MLTPEEMRAAPSWLTSWSRHWKRRDRIQHDQPVYKCRRCLTLHGKNPDRSPWQYGTLGTDFRQLVLACGHFIKQGETLPEIAGQ